MRRLFASGDFVRLWALGGIANAMRWLELLAAGLFTFEATGSGLAVAIVSAARSMPLLCFGAVAGVVCEAVDRKRLLIAGMLLTASASASVCALAWAGLVQPWHVGLAAFVSGSVWATEMATRRRMVGEAAGSDLVSRAVAVDSLTGSCTRMAGPLLGSIAYARLGLAGAFAISGGCYLIGAMLLPGLRHVQETRRLRLGRIPRDLLESLSYARRQPVVMAVLGVSVAMNMFGFSYVALVAPIARLEFGVSDAWVGLLAAAESLGGLIGGLVLTQIVLPPNTRALTLGGSVLFMATLALLPLAPTYGAACAALTLGGIGLAVYSNMQTTLILTQVPASIRSRQLGLLTVSMGTGPLGQLLIGVMSARFGPLPAVAASACMGLLLLALVGLRWTQAGDGKRF